MKAKPTRTRLDAALVERGLASSQKEAQAMILAGEVKVDGVPARKAGEQFASDAKFELTRQQRYVSRGGLKLEGALADFSVNPAGRICLDMGSSTGGFTDCLLQHGASKVFAVDVNLAQLAWKLQQDVRVVKVQRNARALSVSDVPESPSFVAVDVSFISVCKVLAPAIACAAPNADFLILIKPQFELRREEVPAGGVVGDSRLHQKAVAAVEKCAASTGLLIHQTLPSRVTGAEGNQEFFLHARKRH